MYRKFHEIINRLAQRPIGKIKSLFSIESRKVRKHQAHSSKDVRLCKEEDCPSESQSVSDSQTSE